jgi:tetratricopeptide (TPR) repeat protein
MYGQPSRLIELVQRGMASQQAGMLDAAEALYRQALAIDANQFEAVHFLGVLQAQRGNLLEAERLVSRSLTLNAQRAEAHLNHARILRDLQRPEATVESCNRALRLNAGLVAASVLLGNALRDLACYDAALEAYERAIALRPGYHDAIYNRGILQLGKGQFEQGWAGFEHRFEISEQTVRRPALPGRVWAGEPLSGKSIVVHGEQGYGDIIMTSRYLSQLGKAGAQVTFFVVPELLRLLRTLSTPIELAARVDARTFDYQCALMSLPHRLWAGSGFATAVPYLGAEAELLARWRARIGDHGFKVGICWQGSPNSKADRGRSIRLAQLAPLAQVPGVRLISLQTHHGLDQLQRLPPGMIVETLGEDYAAGPDSFVDAAAAMHCVDLVVTTDTAPAHLAGALGRPCWVLLMHVPDWRWFIERDDSPWYPHTRLFRQAERGNWETPVHKLADELIRVSGVSRIR